MDELFGASSSLELDASSLKCFEDEYNKLLKVFKNINESCQIMPQNYFELIINSKNIQRQISNLIYSVNKSEINQIDYQKLLNRAKNNQINFYARLIKERPDIFFKMLPSIQRKFNLLNDKFTMPFNPRIQLDSSSGFMVLLVRKYIEGLGNQDLNQIDLNQDIAKIFAVSFYISFSYSDNFNKSVIIEALKRLNSIKSFINPGIILAYYLYFKNGETRLLTGNMNSSGISEVIYLLLASPGLNKYFIDFIETISELVPFREIDFLINQVIFGRKRFCCMSSSIKQVARPLLKNYRYPENLYTKLSAEELIYLIGDENRLIDRELLSMQFQMTTIEKVRECFEYLQKKFIGYRTDVTAIHLKEALMRDLNQMVKLATTLIQNGININACVQDNDFPIIIWNVEDVTEEIQSLIGGLNDVGLNLYVVNLKDLDDDKHKRSQPSLHTEPSGQLPF